MRNHRILLLFVCLACEYYSYSQNIIRAEYFIDKDPGIGKGNPLNITKSDTILKLTDSIALNSLKSGFHTLSIRFKNSSGSWGLFETRSFYISGDTSNNTHMPVISRAEYFIDKDPGTGKGKALTVNKSDTSVIFSDSIAVGTLQAGFHTISIRTKNATGLWGYVKTKSFFLAGDITDKTVLPSITKAEYFFDKDPGNGKGRSLNINTYNTTVNLKDSITVSTLKPGFHTFSIRNKNATGSWGSFTTRSFYLSGDTANTTSLLAITKAEYFIGTDPGEGKGKPLKISITDTVVNLSDSVLINTSIPGNYTLSVRTKNAEGRWSLLTNTRFFIPYDTTDNDRDGLVTWKEVTIYGTDPKNFDTNNDGLADGVNVFVGLMPKATDTDGDGISNIQEIINGTNPVLADTDGDGVSDKLDAFPLDRFRTGLPLPNASDHTAPVITLEEPF